MEFTYDNVKTWFDNYFQTFNENEGNPETVPNMRKFFTPDLEFFSYNVPYDRPASLEGLLRAMEHPGFSEAFTPQDYVIDEKRMVVVAHLILQFTEKSTGEVFPARHASAHYYLVQDENNDLKITKILYFTEFTPPGEPSIMERMRKYREEAGR